MSVFSIRHYDEARFPFYQRITGFATGAAWGDYDRDGHVDLFVSRYVHVDMNHLPAFGSDEKFCRFKGVLVQCGPWGMQGEGDYLFHNRGDGTFEDVSKKSGNGRSSAPLWSGRHLGGLRQRWLA